MKILRLIWKIVGTVLTVCIALLLCINLYKIVVANFFHQKLPTVFGFSEAIVLSGSMEDAIHVDDMIINHAQDEYEVSDIVTYLPDNNGTPVTHRIIEINGEEIITKGDANNTQDPAIRRDQIVGKVIFIIPGVGAFIQKLQSPLGMLIMLLIGVLLIEIPNIANAIIDKKNHSN